jgi:hypothetical protein
MTIATYFWSVLNQALPRAYSRTRVIMFAVSTLIAYINSRLQYPVNVEGWVIVFAVLGTMFAYDFFVGMPRKMVNERDQEIAKLKGRIDQRGAIKAQIDLLGSLLMGANDLQQQAYHEAFGPPWKLLESDHQQWVTNAVKEISNSISFVAAARFKSLTGKFTDEVRSQNKHQHPAHFQLLVDLRERTETLTVLIVELTNSLNSLPAAA